MSNRFTFSQVLTFFVGSILAGRVIASEGFKPFPLHAMENLPGFTSFLFPNEVYPQDANRFGTVPLPGFIFQPALSVALLGQHFQTPLIFYLQTLIQWLEHTTTLRFSF
ncbi:MAG: hypothetical protein A4S09_17505 [Proteobacteria bacterium SG_bin7]|nr:MAG: hypothetical protein A4S09_17505 [Proteobacteria bacterium SG_bin7]